MLERLVKTCDVLVENFAPGALDRMGLTWEHIHSLNPRMIVASVKGFGPGPYEDCKVYENVAQCAGGSASTTGFHDGTAAGDRRADRRFRHRPAPGAGHRERALPAQAHRPRPARAGGHAGRRAQPLPRQAARPAAPRARAAQGIHAVRPGHPVRRGDAARRQRFGRRPARRHPEVQGLGDRSQRLHLLHHPGAGVGEDLRPDRRARLEDPSGLRQAAGAPAAAEGDLRAHRAVDHDQDQVRGHERVQRVRHPGRPDPVDEGDWPRSRRCAQTGTVVEVDHPTRGKYLSVGNPIKLSDSITEVEALAACWASTPTRS